MAKPHHREEYIYLPGLTHNSAIIAWGAFFFEEDGDEFELVDDDDLHKFDPGRTSSIGSGSEPYGEAEVEVLDMATGNRVALEQTATDNHVEITGLSPNTMYKYKVTVNGNRWAGGNLLTYDKDDKALLTSNVAYNNMFKTFPPPDQPADVNFAVIGDFGKRSEEQFRLAQALEVAVPKFDIRFMITTGDNIYRKHIFNTQGHEDDDWLLTYFQPYRHVINSIPVFPCIGNHDADESEKKDDRGQLYTNFYADQRFGSSEDASIGPGLFYRFRYGSKIEFISLDTSQATDDDLPGKDFTDRLFLYPKHRDFLNTILEQNTGARWRIPFCHHPPYSKGKDHGDTEEGMYEVAEMMERAGVCAFFSGHSHSFQHFEHDHAGGTSHYIVTGGGGDPKSVRLSKSSQATLKHYGGEEEAHALVVKIRGNRMEIIPIGEYTGVLSNLPIRDANRNPFSGILAIEI